MNYSFTAETEEHGYFYASVGSKNHLILKINNEMYNTCRPKQNVFLKWILEKRGLTV